MDRSGAGADVGGLACGFRRIAHARAIASMTMSRRCWRYRLPLLQSRPELIFAGESRTVYQVDPVLAAQLIGKPPGSAVNIAYDAGEPLALLAAMRRQPDLFQKADVVVSVAPFLFNEGVRSAAVYPQDVAARLGVFEQMRSFLPLRVGTLIRFIREAFNARLAADQHIADLGAQPAAFGLKVIDRTQPDDRWPAEIGSHAHYADWDLSGPKARFETRRALRHGGAGGQADRRGAALGAALPAHRRSVVAGKGRSICRIGDRCRPPLRL